MQSIVWFNLFIFFVNLILFIQPKGIVAMLSILLEHKKILSKDFESKHGLVNTPLAVKYQIIKLSIDTAMKFKCQRLPKTTAN